MKGRAATANVDIVAVESDVDRADRRRFAGAFGDEAPQPVRERDAPGLDADERDPSEVGIPLDDLVRDPRERPPEGLVVEEDGSRRDLGHAQGAQGPTGMRACSVIRLLSGLTGPG